MGFGNSNEPSFERADPESFYNDLQKSIDFWNSYYNKYLGRDTRKVKITRTYTETVEYEE